MNTRVKVLNYQKANIFPYTKTPGAFIDSQNLVINDQIIMGISGIKLIGPHNLENVCAAVTVVWQVHQNVDAIKSVLTSFTGLEHRLNLQAKSMECAIMTILLVQPQIQRLLPWIPSRNPK